MKGAGYLQQTCILCARFARSWMRSPVSLAMQALQYMVAAALMGKWPSLPISIVTLSLDTHVGSPMHEA